MKSENKFLQGFYKPKNPEKYMGDPNNVVYRSSYERKAFIWCDITPNIKKWSSEEIVIKYYDSTTGKTRRYFPDLMIQIENSSGQIKNYILEIKPKKQTLPPKESKRKKQSTLINEYMTYQKNCDKWEAARDFCKNNNLEFMILTEDELGIK